MKNCQAIIEKYRGQVLGRLDYLGAKSPEVTVEVFGDPERLLHFLNQMDSFEASLTEAGLRFLEDYYGLNQVVKMILSDVEEGVGYKYTDPDDLLNWLKRLGMPEGFDKSRH